MRSANPCPAAGTTQPTCRPEASNAANTVAPPTTCSRLASLTAPGTRSGICDTVALRLFSRMRGARVISTAASAAPKASESSTTSHDWLQKPVRGAVPVMLRLPSSLAPVPAHRAAWARSSG